MNPIRIGLVGLGRFAALHGRIWQQMPNVQVTAICDRNPEQFAIFKAWFPQAECYTDWREMLQQQKLDAVDVLTPEHLHKEPVAAALEAGLHVFVEKPLAHSPEDAALLIETAMKHNRLLMTGHVLRFDPRYAAVKMKLSAGEYGPLRSIYAKRNNGKAFFSMYNRVAPVYILGIHDIDLMHWYMEDEVCEVYATSPPGADGSGDLSWAMLKFSRGGIGILENNWLLPDGASSFADVRMEITAEDGAIQIHDPEQSISYIGNNKIDVPSLIAGFELHGRIGGALANELEHFVACVTEGKTSEILLPHDALRAVRVAAAIEQSATERRPVSLSMYGRTGQA